MLRVLPPPHVGGPPGASARTLTFPTSRQRGQRDGPKRTEAPPQASQRPELAGPTGTVSSLLEGLARPGQPHTAVPRRRDSPPRRVHAASLHLPPQGLLKLELSPRPGGQADTGASSGASALRLPVRLWPGEHRGPHGWRTGHREATSGHSCTPGPTRAPRSAGFGCCCCISVSQSETPHKAVPDHRSLRSAGAHPGRHAQCRAAPGRGSKVTSWTAAQSGQGCRTAARDDLIHPTPWKGTGDRAQRSPTQQRARPTGWLCSGQEGPIAAPWQRKGMVSTARKQLQKLFWGVGGGGQSLGSPLVTPPFDLSPSPQGPPFREQPSPPQHTRAPCVTEGPRRAARASRL